MIFILKFIIKTNASAGCQAPVASSSTKELRLKGSSFLRRHASRHGIANASRKLTAQVIRELSQHYLTAHKVVVAEDDLQVVNSYYKNIFRIAKNLNTLIVLG